MSWYQEAAASFTYRTMIVVDNTGAAVTPKDVSITIPPHWEGWMVCNQVDGRDLRVTQADGITLVNYDLESFDATTHVLTVELDDVTVTANRNQVFWLYYGSDDATDATSAVTPSSALTGYVIAGASVVRTFAYREESQGTTRPTARFQKRANEELWIACDFGAAMIPAFASYNDHLDYEEIGSFRVQVELAGSAQSAMVDGARNRGVGKATLLAWVQAGSSGSTYTVVITATTTLGRVLEARCLLTVQDDSEQ